MNLSLRLDEIRQRRTDLLDEKNLLFFFENRDEWENRSRENEKLFSELKLDEKALQESEKEYAENLFENARRISQGKYTPPIIKQLNKNKK